LVAVMPNKQPMISQYEVGGILRAELPQLATKACPARMSLEVYAFINYFTDYTREVVERHDFSAATKCFQVAENLFRQGDRMVRMLVENVFVYGFSALLPKDHKERSRVRSLIPDILYDVYIKQVMQPGC